MFDQPPAHWARNGGSEVLALNSTALVGEYFTFQAGVYANGGVALENLTVSFGGGLRRLLPPPPPPSDASPDGAAALVPASAMTCFNLGGNDQNGEAFVKNFTVGAGQVGSLWFGVDLAVLGAAGTFTGTITIAAANRHNGGAGESKELHLSLDVAMPANGKPLPLHGDADVYKMRRLRWLDSTLGIDDEVTKPFKNITGGMAPIDGYPCNPNNPPGSCGIKLNLVNKRVDIHPNGLPANVVVVANQTRGGKAAIKEFDALRWLGEGATPVAFDAILAGAAGGNGTAADFRITQPATITSQTSATVTWKAVLESASMMMDVVGLLDFDSYLEYSVTVTATKPVSLEDMVLTVKPDGDTARLMCGLGTDGAYIHDLDWTWDMQQGNNRLWFGRVEAGVYVYPRGDGPDWENPDYSKDYPTLPFIPESWGGVGARNATKTATGASVKGGVFATTSGPRTLAAGESVTFQFDMAFTPSKPLDLKRHWESRYLQIGYGVGYTTPKEVADMGVTVATLHQGIGGVWNASDGTQSMVNPYINWPFVPDVVDFMEDYTQQAHALDVQVKFYYTIRELTNHVAELYVQ